MIENYGDVGYLSIFVGVMVWYLKYTTRQNAEREKKSDEERVKREEKRDADQKEERDYYRNLIGGDLKKNAILNTKSLTLQKGMMKDLKDHNGHSEKFSEKVIETLNLMCDKLNGGSSKMVKAKKILDKDRRKENVKVEEDRKK